MLLGMLASACPCARLMRGRSVCGPAASPSPSRLSSGSSPSHCKETQSLSASVCLRLTLPSDSAMMSVGDSAHGAWTPPVPTILPRSRGPLGQICSWPRPCTESLGTRRRGRVPSVPTPLPCCQRSLRVAGCGPVSPSPRIYSFIQCLPGFAISLAFPRDSQSLP